MTIYRFYWILLILLVFCVAVIVVIVKFSVSSNPGDPGVKCTLDHPEDTPDVTTHSAHLLPQRLRTTSFAEGTIRYLEGRAYRAHRSAEAM